MQLSPQISGLICIILGLGSGIYLIWRLVLQSASKHWSTTTGVILESNLEEDSDGWYPNVRYEYAVQRKRYANDQLYFYAVNGSTNKRDAKKHLTPYPVGKTVTIYYNPTKPEESVLDRQVPLWRHFFWLFFTLFLLIAGVAMLLS